MAGGWATNAVVPTRCVRPAWAVARLTLRHSLSSIPPLLESALAIEHDPFVREELTLALTDLAMGETNGRTDPA